MAKRRLFYIILTFITVITFLSCTGQNNSDFSDEIPPKEYLTNVFAEEEVVFPDGFDLLNGAAEYRNDTLRCAGTKSIVEDGKRVTSYLIYETGSAEREIMLEFDDIPVTAEFGFFNNDDLILVDFVSSSVQDGIFEPRVDIIRYNITSSETERLEGANRLLPVMDSESAVITSAAADP